MHVVAATLHCLLPHVPRISGMCCVSAGGDTTTKTSIFKHDTDTWVPGPDMNVGRGYQAQTTTEDGQVCTMLAVTYFGSCPGSCAMRGCTCSRASGSISQAPHQSCMSGHSV